MQSLTYRSLTTSLCMEEWKYSLGLAPRNQQQLFSSRHSANCIYSSFHSILRFLLLFWALFSPACPSFLLQTFVPYKRDKLQWPFDQIFAQRKIKRNGIVDFWVHDMFRFNSIYKAQQNIFSLHQPGWRHKIRLWFQLCSYISFKKSKNYMYDCS